jgi:hypothetical protein
LFFLPRNDVSDRFQLGRLRAFANIFAANFLPARILRALVVLSAADKSISSRSIIDSSSHVACGGAPYLFGFHKVGHGRKNRAATARCYSMPGITCARWTPPRSGLKLTACDISPGKKPNGPRGPERRLVAPLNACPLLPRMQGAASLSVSASLRNRGQFRHGITTSAAGLYELQARTPSFVYFQIPSSRMVGPEIGELLRMLRKDRGFTVAVVVYH